MDDPFRRQSFGSGVYDKDAWAARGAVIRQKPANQFGGDGHVWIFAQTVRRVPREEAVAASGLEIEGWH